MVKDGGSAFPSHGSMGEVAQKGMTLRDYFAGKAMQALVLSFTDNGRYPDLVKHAAQLAYSAADALLKARDA